MPLIGTLAFDPRFGYTPTEAEKNDPEKLGEAVLVELGRRAAAARASDPNRAPAALLILDNVSEPDLLAATQLSRLQTVDWLRLIATTRLDPAALDPARKRIETVEVDSLDPDNALRLIQSIICPPAGSEVPRTRPMRRRSSASWAASRWPSSRSPSSSA